MLNRLATDVPFIACVINSSNTFAYDLDLSNFISESGLSFQSFNHLSPVGLFCECCRMSLLCFQLTWIKTVLVIFKFFESMSCDDPYT